MATKGYKPDCGYAWMVVVGCFAINFIMAGLARAAGVLYVALIEVYGVSREVATAPFSLRFCVRNLSGPLVGALGQHFGIRPIVLLGGLICGLGGILSALSPDVTWITAAWGGIHGLGYGMCNIIHVLIIYSYFEKYKGLALGISMAGDCIGTFILPLVLEQLLSTYALHGTFLILAGISLNVIPAAMLLRSPEWEESDPDPYILSQKSTDVIKYNNETLEEGIDNKAFDKTSDNCHIKAMVNNVKHNLPKITINKSVSNEISVKEVSDDNKIKDGSVNPKRDYMQYIDFWFNEKNKNSFSKEDLNNYIRSLRQSASLRITDNILKKKRFKSKFLSNNRRLSSSSVLSCPSNIAIDARRKSSISVNNLHPSTASIIYSKDNTTDGFQRNDTSQCTVTRTLSICDSSLKQPVSIIHVSLDKGQFTDIKLRYDSEDEEKDVDKQKNRKASVFNSFIETNTKPIFLTICATMALCAFFFISIFTVTIDYAKDSGIPSEYGKYLIIAFSVTDCFGRIVLGIVLDKKWITLRNFAGLTVGLQGLIVAIMPFYKSFAFWITSFGICGFMQGGTAILFPMLVENYMDKNEESVALGSLNFYGGLLMLPVPPMIGYFRDNIGSYDGVFWTVGSLCVFAGCLWIFEPWLSNAKKTCPDRTKQDETKLNNEIPI